MKTQTKFTLEEIASEIGTRISKAEKFEDLNVRRLGEDEFTFVSDFDAYFDEFFGGDDDEPDEAEAWQSWADAKRAEIREALEGMIIRERRLSAEGSAYLKAYLNKQAAENFSAEAWNDEAIAAFEADEPLEIHPRYSHSGHPVLIRFDEEHFEA